MNNLNYLLFEEFKRLDGLCEQIYNEKHGITKYIDSMETSPWNSNRLVTNWNEDLKQLKRLRHIRNQLAHAEGSFQEECCTQYDIEWIQSFYKRILIQADPFAVLQQKTAKTQPQSPAKSASCCTRATKSKSKWPRLKVLIAASAIFIIFLVFILWKYSFI